VNGWMGWDGMGWTDGWRSRTGVLVFVGVGVVM